MKNSLGRFLICLTTFSLLAGSLSLGLLAGWENFLEDRLFFAKPIHPDILIVAIDDQSIERFGQWPWPRRLFSDFFLKLDKAQPVAAGLDVMLAEPSRLGSADDLRLAEALRQISYPVIFPAEATETKEILPLDIFRESATLGFVNLIIDRDGLVRKFPSTINNYQPFSYQLVKAADKKISEKENLKAVNRIVYAGPPNSFKQIPFWRVMEKDLGKQLENKIVLIGVTAPDFHDDRPTPVSRGQVMTGVEIQANIVNMLLYGYRLIPSPPFFSYSWLALAAFLPLLIIFYSRSLPALVLSNFGAGFVYLVLQIGLFGQGVAVNVIHIHLAWIISSVTLMAYQYLVIDREKSFLRKTFQYYLAPEVIEEIVSNPEKLKLGGERKKVTILFSDIRGFTTLSEKMKPEDLMHIINEYLSAMTDIIMKRKGLVDKYIGDAIMAFWGAPLDNQNQADDACLSAIEMAKALKDLNKHWQSLGLSELAIGVGLNTGEVVVGNMGSNQRMNYSLLGDEVNLASRLEGLNKAYGTECIISESTKKEIKNTDNIYLRELDLVTVKGKKEPTLLYEIITEPVDNQLKTILDLFAEGRSWYTQGQWNNAIDKFSEALRIAEDGPSRTFLDRCLEMKNNPPKNWVGVYEFHSK